MTDADAVPEYDSTQLGMYTVIEDIAEGTFGKVKSKPVKPLSTFSSSAAAFGSQHPIAPF